MDAEQRGARGYMGKVSRSLRKFTGSFAQTRPRGVRSRRRRRSTWQSALRNGDTEVKHFNSPAQNIGVGLLNPSLVTTSFLPVRFRSTTLLYVTITLPSYSSNAQNVFMAL